MDTPITIFALTCTGKDLRAAGETEQRLYGLDAWEESSYYTDRERAALAWTEAITTVKDGHVPDKVYERVRPLFLGEGIGGSHACDCADQRLEPPEYRAADGSRYLSAGEGARALRNPRERGLTICGGSLALNGE